MKETTTDDKWEIIHGLVRAMMPKVTFCNSADIKRMAIEASAIQGYETSRALALLSEQDGFFDSAQKTFIESAISEYERRH